MFKPLTLDEGRILIQIARSEIWRRFGINFNVKVPEKLYSYSFPVFISFEKIIFSEGMCKRILRGSMGCIKPIKDLVNDVKYVAVYAAFNDPRYSPITQPEFRNCVVELTILSEPKKINLEELNNSLILGYHAICINSGNKSAIILPQKQVEIAEKFWLSHRRRLTIKDLVDYIRLSICNNFNNCEINVYETQIFYELQPDGLVIERKIYLNRLFQNNLELLKYYELYA